MTDFDRDFQKEILELKISKLRFLKSETSLRFKYDILLAVVFTGISFATSAASKVQLPFLQFLLDFLLIPQFVLLVVGLFLNFEIKRMLTPVYVLLILDILRCRSLLKHSMAIREQIDIKITTLLNVRAQRINS